MIRGDQYREYRVKLLRDRLTSFRNMRLRISLAFGTRRLRIILPSGGLPLLAFFLALSRLVNRPWKRNSSRTAEHGSAYSQPMIIIAIVGVLFQIFANEQEGERGERGNAEASIMNVRRQRWTGRTKIETKQARKRLAAGRDDMPRNGR